MATAAGETRETKILWSDVPRSEDIRLVSKPIPADDAPVAVQTPPLFQYAFNSTTAEQQESATQNTPFVQQSLRQPSPLSMPPKARSMPHSQAGNGGGAGVGGRSTSNPSGGGGSTGGGGGGGPGVVNASQFIGFNFDAGAVGPASQPGQPAQTPASPPTLDPQSTPANDAPAQTPMTPQLGNSLQPPGQANLYVLDRNNGETLPANVTLNTFSTWSENLLAQVSGGAVSSYSWNLTQAPDFTNASGQNTANLQGTWANFTGAPRTNVISVTESPVSGMPVTQTMTFEVAGTDSPAFSSSRPTSSSTWSSVITPDQLSSGQSTQAAGPYASIGQADGSMQTSFSMPSYNPNTTPVRLDYNSTTANAQPIFLDEYQLPFGQSVPSSISAQLTFNGTPLTAVTYNTSGLNPGDIVQIALQANDTALPTGRYPWSIAVTDNGTPTTNSGNVDIVNQASSAFGAGWSLDNVEQLVSVSGGMMLVNPDGTSLYFANNGSGGFTTPAGDFSTLTLSNGVYTRTMPDGTKINFNSSGQQTSIVDRDGNTTTFGYTGGQLTTITDMNGQVTTLAYTNGLLSSITDPANRTATLAYTGSQLTSITDPGNDVWQYGYDSANDMTALTDPNNHTTTFSYNTADRVASVTLADNTTEKLTAMQMNGWAAAGSNNVTAVLLATGDQALFTDGRSNVWNTGLDWLGYGQSVLNTDPLGDTSLTYRDINGEAWMASDPLARATRSFFNSQGDATEIVNPDNSDSLYQYNNYSEVTKYTDPTGDITTYTYNTKGDLTQETNALNNSTTYAYNTAGLVTSTTDARNNTTNYSYNSLNELTGVTNALNQTTTYADNNAGLVSSITDALGYTSTYTYDALNNLTSETLPDSKTTDSIYSYTYDKAGNETSTTDPLNHTTSYGYNAVNELTSATNALNQTTTYAYDADGNETSVTNPLNQTTTYTYNAANELTGVTNALGYAYTYTFDAAGEKLSSTNPLNQKTTYSYNSRGWLATVTDPLGDVTGYTYDAYGDQIIVSQSSSQNVPMPGGNPSISASLTYNAVHELTDSTDPMGNKTTYGYDADGNQTSVTNGLNLTTTYTYNALNELTGVTDPLNHQTTYGYDADGNQTSITDPLGHITSMTYDAQGRDLTETAPNGGITTYKYDLAGNLLSLTDPDNNTTSYTYDAANELITTTNPLGYQSTNGYNAAGELTSTTDADGRTIDYGYNAIGQETSETWVGGNYTATYQYNQAGELTSASDPYSTYTYTYDADGHETSVSNAGTPGVPTVSLNYTYDAVGDRTGLTDSLGGSISYSYNADQQLTQMILTTPEVSPPNPAPYAQVTFAYDADNRLTGMTRSSGTASDTIATSYSYDNANDLTNITDTDTTKSTTLANYTYGYDAASELTSYQDNGGNSLTYGYDTNSELTCATGTLAAKSYTFDYNYDLNGNRTSTSTDVNGTLTSATYTTGTGNALSSDGTYTYTYDKDGNTLSQTNIATGYVTYYSWDYRNRLTEVTQEDNHGNVLNDEKFTYDVNDNRIAVSLNGSPQLYTVYDGANPYMDFNGSGTLTQRYLYNPNSLNQFYGQLSANGTTEWLLTDKNNSIRQVVSSSGSSLDAIIYDPYGNIDGQTNATNAPRFGYTGAVEDSITGDVLAWTQPYNPMDGRWLSQQRLGLETGDSNGYRYNPLVSSATSWNPGISLPPPNGFGIVTGGGSTTQGFGPGGGTIRGIVYPPTLPPTPPPSPLLPPNQPPAFFGPPGGFSLDPPPSLLTPPSEPPTPPRILPLPEPPPPNWGWPDPPPRILGQPQPPRVGWGWSPPKPGGEHGGAFFPPPELGGGDGDERKPYLDLMGIKPLPGTGGNPHTILGELPDYHALPIFIFGVQLGYGVTLGEGGGWHQWHPEDYNPMLWLIIKRR